MRCPLRAIAMTRGKVVQFYQREQRERRRGCAVRQAGDRKAPATCDRRASCVPPPSVGSRVMARTKLPATKAASSARATNAPNPAPPLKPKETIPIGSCMLRVFIAQQTRLFPAPPDEPRKAAPFGWQSWAQGTSWMIIICGFVRFCKFWLFRCAEFAVMFDFLEGV